MSSSPLDVAVLLIDRLHRSDPFPPAVRTVVGSGTMIYTEGFGAEFIRAEPVFLHVGVSIHSMDQQMPAAYYLQLFAADTAPDEVYAFSTES